MAGSPETDVNLAGLPASGVITSYSIHYTKLYEYRAGIGSVGSYPFSSAVDYQVASAPSTLNNPELKWETSEQLDLGFDIRLFDNRMSFGLDYFDKKTKDLLVETTPPLET